MRVRGPSHSDQDTDPVLYGLADPADVTGWNPTTPLSGPPDAAARPVSAGGLPVVARSAPAVAATGDASFAAAPHVSAPEPVPADQTAQATAKSAGPVTAAVGAMTINLLYDAAALGAPASFRDGMQTAANMLMAAFNDAVTINIAVGYGEFPAFNGQASQSLPNQNTSEGGPWGNSLSYATLRQDLVNTASSADDNSSVASLPNTSSLQGHSSFFVANSQLKAFGLSPGGAADGGVGMGRNFTGDVLISGALHELTHAMGRTPGTSLDLFRFNEDHSENRVFGGNIPATPAYFSIDGGTTDLADFGINSDPGDFLNPPNSNRTPNDPFNEIIGNLATLTPVDLTVMDVLGFHR